LGKNDRVGIKVIYKKLCLIFLLIGKTFLFLNTMNNVDEDIKRTIYPDKYAGRITSPFYIKNVPPSFEPCNLTYPFSAFSLSILRDGLDQGLQEIKALNKKNLTEQITQKINVLKQQIIHRLLKIKITPANYEEVYKILSLLNEYKSIIFDSGICNQFNPLKNNLIIFLSNSLKTSTKDIKFYDKLLEMFKLVQKFDFDTKFNTEELDQFLLDLKNLY
jgi:hypothetical protein